MKYYTTTQAAKYLGYHKDSIRNMIRNQLIEAEKFGRDWFIPEHALKKYKPIIKKKPGHS